MKFKKGAWGYLKLGVIFTLFMFVISLIFMFVIIPLMLVPMGVGLLTGSATTATLLGGVVSLLLLFISFVVVGWAVFYFFRKNTFIYKRMRR